MRDLSLITQTLKMHVAVANLSASEKELPAKMKKRKSHMGYRAGPDEKAV
jgi:hypothetical protein